MLSRSKQCKLQHKVMIRLNNFLYVFNLRQGTILIAVHQIALSSFILVILLTGLSHVGEMLSMLNSDMEDDAERHGFYEANYGYNVYHEGDVISTNNRMRFAKAQNLATETVFLFGCSTCLMFMYLACCISLLHGAINYKREYILPWITAASISALMITILMVMLDGYPFIVKIFGGHALYRFGCALFLFTYIYAICAVSSFAFDTPFGRCAQSSRVSTDERGERLLLLDHAAHSSLLSTAQYNKLSHAGTKTQFV